MTLTATALALPDQKAMTSTDVLRGLHTVRTVLAPELSDDELKLFALVATRSGLDPFAKQIYAVKRQGRVTFQTGIDGYRSIAARTGMYDVQDEPEFGPTCGCGDKRPEGHPEFATVRVYRKGVGRPIAATAHWHEYKPEQGQSGRQDSMWVRMPRVMIAKVAEALALRKAFPYDPERKQGIGADLYTADEMTQADRPTTPARPPLQERLAARRAAVEAPDEPADDDVDVFTEPTAAPAPPAAKPSRRGSRAAVVEEPIEEGVFTEAPAAESIDLTTSIRAAAAASDLEGPATDAQRNELAQLFAGMQAAVTVAGIGALFKGSIVGGRPQLTGAQAAAILLVAGSLDREALRAAWAELASSPA